MNRQKLVPLSYEEHVAIGKELKATRVRLRNLVLQLCRAYGVSSKPVKHADQAFDRLSLLRFELDNKLCGELPLTDDRWRGVYYGENTE